MMRPSAVAILSLLSTLQITGAQTANGVIVPFSTLPTCATLCGPLFDVQGKCSPPASATVDDSCFCSDSRLTPFTESGTTGVSQVCGPASCSAAADLTAIQSWYTSFCAANKGVTSAATGTATTTAATSTKTSSSSNGSSSSNNGSSVSSGKTTWFSTHYKWVIMIIVMFVVIVGTWIAACLFRRRYLRKKEKEIEMLPPVALGPHQLQAMTGGYRYGDGVVDNSRGAPARANGHHKEMASVEAHAANGSAKHSKGLMKKRDRT